MADGNQSFESESDAGNNGDRVIGGTLRADGTVRKTLKVRPGFTPAEEVKKYDVRERMLKRQEEKFTEAKDQNNSGRKPGTRPNRQFGAINNILQSNTPQRRTTKTFEKPTSKDKSDTELIDSIEKLSLQPKDSSNLKEKEPNSSPKASTTTSKKYIPPSRRNKPTKPENSTP